MLVKSPICVSSECSKNIFGQIFHNTNTSYLLFNLPTDWINSGPAIREAAHIWVSSSQHAIRQNCYFSQRWTEPRLLPGALPHRTVLILTKETGAVWLTYVSFSLCGCLRQVQDLSPLPGMIVSPWEGVIPCGGQSALKVLFTPNSVIKFDTRVKVRDVITQLHVSRPRGSD